MIKENIEKINIGVLIQNIVPYQIARINSFKESKNYNVFILCALKKDKFKIFNEVKYFSEFQIIYLQDLSIKEIDKLITLKKIKILVTSGYSFKTSIISLIMKRKYKNIYVLACCESNSWDFKRNYIIEFFKSLIIKNFDGFLTGSEKHQEYLKKFLSKENNTVFSTGYDVVDNKHFKSHRFKALKKLENFSFISLSRLEEKKNHLRLIEAFNKVIIKCRKKNIRIPHLYIIGDGYLKNKLIKKVNSLGLDKFVFFTGAIDYELLPLVFHKAYVFIHPSSVEQWGLVVNEAMASSLPILVSSESGCANYLVKKGINGDTFSAYNPYEMANLMFKYLNKSKEDLKTMGLKSLQIIEKDFPVRKYFLGLSFIIKNLDAKPKRISLINSIFLYIIYKIKKI